ncbi:MAG: hypothetical protein CVV55_04380 [Synergistetes bacterium HGW-Synergistetes-2]|nr:MAG: hypothetical protein CVV55_04380 [Synergistetes bacterium HGW-Synergistetes-2]
MPPGKKRGRASREVSPVKNEPLAPRLLAFLVFCVSFSLPNLVFSGRYFFSELHLLKWVVACAPLAILGAVAGYRLLRYGAVSTTFRLDGFGWIWLVLLLYTAAQPLWADVRSIETLWREWFFFSSLWLVYVLASRLTDTSMLRAVLWGGVLSAAISVLMAEMQRRGVAGAYPFILPATRWEYLANSGQRNMLALWLAIGGLNGVYLFFSAERWKLPVRGLLLGLVAAICWGLLLSTSRSGMLGFVMGVAMLSLFFLLYANRKQLLKTAAALFLLVILAFIGFDYSMEKMGRSFTRRFSLKMNETISSVLSATEKEPWLLLGSRGTIWATTWTMFSEQPLKGVGLGQFKWNYLDAQREAQRRWPYLKWGYTYWAHNEFLQWLAETGIAGALLMLFLWLWWAGATFRALLFKPPLPPGAFWGNAMVALFLFNALWTRPFHRIENAVWLALAFAVANREMLRPLLPASWREKTNKLLRPLGAAICLLSLLGLFYLGNGVVGDRTIRRALLATNPLERGALLEKARKSPMVRDLAEKQLAYYSIAFGELQQDPDRIALGVNSMIEVFTKQPHIDELKVLRKWATKLRHADLDRFVSYFTDIPDDLAEVAGGGK